MRYLLTCTGLLLAIIGFAPGADASPITYTLSGTASGQIGATSFTGAAITFTATGDTDNVVDLGIPSVTVFANPFQTLTVTIQGVGTATLTEPSGIFGFPQAIIDPQNEIPPIPLVIFGRLDNPPSLDGFTGMTALGSDLLTGYDLKTDIGPIAGLGGPGFNPDCGTPGNDPCLQTSLGALSFTSNDIVGDATFTARVAPVPEPATLLLMGGGLMALRRRSRSVRRVS